MPNLGGANVSGAGWLNFNDQHEVYAVLVFGSTMPTAQFRSVVHPRRLMHGGWLAVGESPTGPLGNVNGLVKWHKYLEFQNEWMGLVVPMIADGLFYNLPIGHEYYVDVYWNW